MIDPPARRRGPLLTISGLEWKLVLTALLSTIYAFSFVAVARPAAPAPTAGASTQSSPVSVVSIAQPARGASATAATSTVAPTPAPRVVQPRVRTRSS